jgi:hypothetical protein
MNQSTNLGATRPVPPVEQAHRDVWEFWAALDTDHDATAPRECYHAYRAIIGAVVLQLSGERMSQYGSEEIDPLLFAQLMNPSQARALADLLAQLN